MEQRLVGVYVWRVGCAHMRICAWNKIMRVYGCAHITYYAHHGIKYGTKIVGWCVLYGCAHMYTELNERDTAVFP